MTITESTLKIKSNRPRIVYHDVAFKSDALTSDSYTLIANSCIKVDMDFKNNTVVLYIEEFDIGNFYNILNNIFADSNLSLLITRKEPIYSGDIKTYSAFYPTFKFTQGKVIEHHLVCDTRNDGDMLHQIKIKFVKFKASTSNTESI